MTAPFTGGCACGAIRFECNAEPMLVAHCHCTDCQKTSGTQGATVVVVPADAFRLTQGTPASYDFTADSGRRVTRQFCATCGTPLFTEAEAMPGAWIIKAAALDDPSWLEPSMHIYTDSAPPWATIPPGATTFPGMPPLG